MIQTRQVQRPSTWGVTTNQTGGNETLCRTLAAQPPCEGEILRLDGDTLRVDGSEVGVLEERDEVSLGGFLEGHDGRGLEAQVRLHTHIQRQT